jgi:hypothetical protein
MPTLGGDVDALVAAVPRLAATPGAFRVLWVDDNPANNEWERSVLRPEGIPFDNVVSTSEAIEQLSFSRYDLVITDLGRLWSSDRSRSAGSDLLGHAVITEGGQPVIVYGGRKAVAQADALKARGAFGVAADREDSTGWSPGPQSSGGVSAAPQRQQRSGSSPVGMAPHSGQSWGSQHTASPGSSSSFMRPCPPVGRQDRRAQRRPAVRPRG